ncbi:MAG: ABC transporter ATP-binding protein [Anaerolineae bacterium]|nr:ABC transporter ATP-binding protein [Anaerolineae bacterium]
MDTILSIKNLHTYFFTVVGVAKALNGVTLDVPFGKVLGVVGESGCGKSVTALSAMQLVLPPGRIVKGSITLNRVRNQGNGYTVVDEVDITELDPRGAEIRSIRGKDIAMIFQEPMTSLNPSYTVGNQIMEAILLHQDVTKEEARDRAIDILRRVELPNAEAVVDRYPHQLSGGMRQRAMIALALSCTPALLIADEPTTALDVTTEAEILELMRELQAQMGMTIMFITHNLGVVAQMCDEVAVMYLGRVVERAPVDDIFHNPHHPYTEALLRSIPRIGSRDKKRLEPIRGVVPDPYANVPGCPFHDRCSDYMPGVCEVNVPALMPLPDDPAHLVRCFLHSDAIEGDNGYDG